MDAILDNLDLYWQGFRTTLSLLLISGAIALVWGTILGSFRVSPVAPLRWFGTVYVEIVRNTPLTLAFFGVVFVLPRLDIVIDSFFVSAVIALSLYTSAFVCEAVRSGINAIGVGQAEAARSIGLTFGQSLRFVILPQALSHRDPTTDQHLHRADEEHVRRRRLLRLRAVRRRAAAGQREPGRRHRGADRRRGVYLIITVPAGYLAGRLERRAVFAR